MKTSRRSADAKSCSVWNWYRATLVLIVPHAHTQKQHCKQMNRPRATKHIHLLRIHCEFCFYVWGLYKSVISVWQSSIRDILMYFYGMKKGIFLIQDLAHLFASLSNTPLVHIMTNRNKELTHKSKYKLYLRIFPVRTACGIMSYPELWSVTQMLRNTHRFHTTFSLFVIWNSSMLQEALQLCKWVCFKVLLYLWWTPWLHPACPWFQRWHIT